MLPVHRHINGIVHKAARPDSIRSILSFDGRIGSERLASRSQLDHLERAPIVGELRSLLEVGHGPHVIFLR